MNDDQVKVSVIGLVTVVEFQAAVSVNGTDWERLSSVCLRNDLQSFERMPPPDFKPVLRLTIRQQGIYVDLRRTLHFDLGEFQLAEVTDPEKVRVRYRYRNLDGSRFESPELREFALVIEDPEGNGLRRDTTPSYCSRQSGGILGLS